MNGYPILWHPAITLFLFAAVAALTVLAFRVAGHGGTHMWEPHCHRRMGDAIDILEQRFARGEIDQAEFEAKRALLSR